MRAALPEDDPALLRGELEALGVFADLAELSRARPPTQESDAAEEHVHSPREHFHQYLRSLDAEREGVPEAMRGSLARALGHYGVHDLARSRELAEAAYRIFLAQERVPSQLPAVAGLLDGRLRDAGTLPAPLRKELRETLDRLVAATQLRQPAIGELARSARFAAFDRPLIAAARERVYRGVREQLDRLAASPGAPDHAELIEAVVASPQPLMGLLGRAARGRDPRARADARDPDQALLQDPQPPGRPARHPRRSPARDGPLRPPRRAAGAPGDHARPSARTWRTPWRPPRRSCERPTARTARSSTSTSAGARRRTADAMAAELAEELAAAAPPAAGAAGGRVGGGHRRSRARITSPSVPPRTASPRSGSSAGFTR